MRGFAVERVFQECVGSLASKMLLHEERGRRRLKRYQKEKTRWFVLEKHLIPLFLSSPSYSLRSRPMVTAREENGCEMKTSARLRQRAVNPCFFQPSCSTIGILFLLRQLVESARFQPIKTPRHTSIISG